MIFLGVCNLCIDQSKFLLAKVFVFRQITLRAKSRTDYGQRLANDKIGIRIITGGTDDTNYNVGKELSWFINMTETIF